MDVCFIACGRLIYCLWTHRTVLQLFYFRRKTGNFFSGTTPPHRTQVPSLGGMDAKFSALRGPHTPFSGVPAELIHFWRMHLQHRLMIYLLFFRLQMSRERQIRANHSSLLCILAAGGENFVNFMRLWCWREQLCNFLCIPWHQIWAGRKKLQPYLFLRLQQFSAEPPPHPP